MNIESHDLFAKHYVSLTGAQQGQIFATETSNVQVQMSRDLTADLERMKNSGQFLIGSAEFVGRGNLGVGFEARRQAVKVGACCVLVRFTPTKIKSIRTTPAGAIDLGAVLTDPPVSMSPRGYFVVQSFFLAKAAANEA